MKNTRHGLNAKLSYLRGNTRYSYHVRCSAITHEVEMIADESHARTVRAYYPHRTANQQFSITVLLNGWTERRSFVNWMSYYATYVLDPDLRQGDFPAMTVSVPAREFLRRGVPLQGAYEWGDHVGSMLFTHQIMFESAIDPGQQGRPATAFVENRWSAFAKDRAVEFFYPTGTQLNGTQAPDGTYDKIIYPGSPNDYNDNPDPNQPPPHGPNGRDDG